MTDHQQPNLVQCVIAKPIRLGAFELQRQPIDAYGTLLTDHRDMSAKYKLATSKYIRMSSIRTLTQSQSAFDAWMETFLQIDVLYKHHNKEREVDKVSRYSRQIVCSVGPFVESDFKFSIADCCLIAHEKRTNSEIATGKSIGMVSLIAVINSEHNHKKVDNVDTHFSNASRILPSDCLYTNSS